MFKVTKLLVILPFLTLALAAGAGADLLDEPGNPIGPGIPDVAGLPDGSPVTLPAVQVSKICLRGSAPYWICRDTLAPSTIAILGLPPSCVRLDQTLNVAGILGTIGSSRVLLDPTCWVYTNEAGDQILYHRDFPLWRGIMQHPWKWTMEVPVPGTVYMQSLGIKALDDDPQPPGGTGEGTDSSGYTNVIFCDTIDEACQAFDPDSLEPTQVELDCRGLSNPSTTGQFNQFTLLEDFSGSQLPVYWSGSGSLDPTIRINQCIGTIQCDSTGLGDYWIEIDEGPYWAQDEPIGTVNAISQLASIASARTYADGTLVTLSSGCEIVADQNDFGNTIYVQQPGGLGQFAGTMVLCTGLQTPGRGAMVNITGQVKMSPDSSGERIIDATDSAGGSVTLASGTPPAITPLGMVNKFFSGKNFNSFTPGVVGATSLYSEGMLVRAWGTVTAVNPVDGYFYIDDGCIVDGCKLNDSTGCGVGLRVSYAWDLGAKPALLAPEIGWLVSVVGIASSDPAAGGGYYRVLRPRSQDDISVYTQTERVWPGLAPGWAESTIPRDSAPVGDGGPSSADSVNLATGG